MKKKMSIAKRFTGIIIALAMIVGTIPGISPVKNVKAALQGEGTSGSPYLIYTADDLVEFAKIVNGQHDTIRQNNAAWAKLKSDIDMTGVNWTPIGTTTPYNGTFDGLGPLLGTVNEIYKIRNLTCSGDYSGLFGLVGTEGIVQNIIIDAGSATGTRCVGGIAGQNNGRIENCRSFQRVDGTECIGGIAGLNNGTINSCYNYGEISGNRYIGGIAGQSLSTATILYCENGGTIRGKADYIGGIAGYVTNEIHDCVNYGNVSGDNTVGGIAGTNNGTVNTNENHGNISGKEHIGGIVGYNNNDITNCHNYGEVSGILNIGGIAGMHSQGEISGSKCSDISKSTGSKSVGNIVGNGSGSIENYYNIKILAEDATYIHGYTSIAPTTTDNQVALTAIPDPGYEFSSWTNTEHDVLSSLNPSTLRLDRHTTYYMNFVPGTYTVTFHENNGNINSGNVTGYTFGNETNLPTDVTREDYVFGGWFDNENLTGSAITKISDTDYGNKEYWAKWTCNITLDKSPDDGGTVSGGGTYQEGSSVCVTADPANGYSFVKWTENGTTVSSDRSYTFNASGDTDLTAVFEMIPASDPVITGPEELTLQYGYTSGALEVTAVPESGHTINGYQWYQVEDNAGTNPAVITGATSSSYSIPTGLNTGVTKYYYCEVTTKRSDNGLSVTKNSNIAAVTVVKASQTVPSTVAAVDESISGKADGKLKGLSAEMEISSTGSTSGFEAVTGIDSDGSKAYPVGTYYVRYAGDDNHNASEAVTVTIVAGRKLDVKFVNGTETVNTVSVDYNASVSAPSTVPVKDGFIFDGWAADELGSTTFDFTNTKITADTTIYAKWIEKQANEPEQEPEPEQIVTPGPVIYYSPTPTPEAEKAAPTPDSDRVKNEDGTYSKTTVEKSSDGTVKTREVVTDENGKVLKTITTTESTDKEGTKKLNTITVTADGSRSEVTFKTYTSGKEIEVISQKNADGSEFYAKETREADGSSVMNSIRSSATGEVTVNFASTTAEGKSTELTYEGVLPGSAADANSDDNKTESQYSSTKSGGKLTLTLTKGSTNEKNVTISSVLKINGKKYKVTNIASKAFAGNTTIEEITIGKYVTSIEKGAFKNAKNLKDITFKSGKIKEIGKNAFKGIDKNAVITIFAGKKAYANLIELIKGAGIPKAAEFVEIK